MNQWTEDTSASNKQTILQINVMGVVLNITGGAAVFQGELNIKDELLDVISPFYLCECWNSLLHHCQTYHVEFLASELYVLTQIQVKPLTPWMV